MLTGSRPNEDLKRALLRNFAETHPFGKLYCRQNHVNPADKNALPALQELHRAFLEIRPRVTKLVAAKVTTRAFMQTICRRMPKTVQAYVDPSKIDVSVKTDEYLAILNDQQHVSSTTTSTQSLTYVTAINMLNDMFSSALDNLQASIPPDDEPITVPPTSTKEAQSAKIHSTDTATPFTSVASTASPPFYHKLMPTPPSSPSPAVVQSVTSPPDMVDMPPAPTPSPSTSPSPSERVTPVETTPPSPLAGASAPPPEDAMALYDDDGDEHSEHDMKELDGGIYPGFDPISDSDEEDADIAESDRKRVRYSL